MALITNIDEIKPFVAIGEGNYIDSYAPAIDGVEQNEIIYVISQAQYDALQVAYDAGSPGDGQGVIADPKLKVLLAYVQRAIANLAIAESLDFNQVRLSPSGLTRTEKETEKTAYHYQKLDAQDYLYRQGYNAVETLLRFLESQKADYTLWAESSAYTLSRRYFITGADDFQQYYNINRSRRTYQAMMYIMERLETLVIEEQLGEAFIAALKAKTNLLPQEIKFLRYLKAGIANLVIADAVHELGFEFNAKGLQLTKRSAGAGNEEKGRASDNQAEIIAARARGNGNRYLQQAKGYLIENASAEVFTTFFESPLYPKDGGTDVPENRQIRNSDKNNGIYNGF